MRAHARRQARTRARAEEGTHARTHACMHARLHWSCGSRMWLHHRDEQKYQAKVESLNVDDSFSVEHGSTLGARGSEDGCYHITV